MPISSSLPPKRQSSPMKPKEKDLGLQGLKRLKNDLSTGGKEGRAGKVNYPLATLLNGHALCEIARLIDVGAFYDGNMVAKQLQRYCVDDWREEITAMWDV